jgi:hypothetical protein
MKRNEEQGIIMVGALIIMVFFMTIAVGVAEFGLSQYTSARKSVLAVSALNVAEAGADSFLYNMNQDNTYTGTNSEVEFFNNGIQGRGTYQTTISNGAFANEKIMYSTGRVYLPASATTPKETRKVKLVIRGTNPFKYAVQTGTGPFYLYGNSTLIGSFFSNSTFALQDNSVSLSGTIMAAGDDGSTGAGHPCSIYGSNANLSGTINVAKNVCITPRAGSTVTTNDPTVTAQPLPSIPAAVLDSVAATATCGSLTSSPFIIQSAHYPDAGSGTTGGCNVNLKKNTNYTLNGTVHIRGDLNIDGNVISLAEGITTDTYVIVEGKINITGNGSAIASNSNGAALIFVSNDTGDCNGDKNCSNNAINIISNTSSFNSLFLALNGSIGYEGRGSIGSIASKSTVINGNGTITFLKIDTTSLDYDFWDVKYYQQVFN